MEQAAAGMPSGGHVSGATVPWTGGGAAPGPFLQSAPPAFPGLPASVGNSSLASALFSLAAFHLQSCAPPWNLDPAWRPPFQPALPTGGLPAILPPGPGETTTQEQQAQGSRRRRECRESSPPASPERKRPRSSQPRSQEAARSPARAVGAKGRPVPPPSGKGGHRTRSVGGYSARVPQASRSKKAEKELSDDEDDEPISQTGSSRLFRAEHFERLLKKVVATLKYPVDSPEEPAWPKLDKRIFPSPLKRLVCPFPYCFEKVLRAEWAVPGGGSNSLTSFAKRFYALPEATMKVLDVPRVDAPVGDLHSRAGVLRDPVDRKKEALLKKAHQASSLAIRASAVASDFSRAIVVWADDLLQDPEPDPLMLKKSLLKIKMAAQFVADASQDALQFSARAQAATIAVRRHLWLKPWRVDTQSIITLSEEKFSGQMLFGEEVLDKVLVEVK